MGTMGELLLEPVWRSTSVQSNGSPLVIMKMHRSDSLPQRVTVTQWPQLLCSESIITFRLRLYFQ